MTMNTVDTQSSAREFRVGFMALLDEYDYTQPVRGQILEHCDAGRPRQ